VSGESRGGEAPVEGVIGGTEYRYAKRADDFEAGLLYRVMKEDERTRRAAAIAGHLGKADPEIQQRQVQHFAKADWNTERKSFRRPCESARQLSSEIPVRRVDQSVQCRGVDLGTGSYFHVYGQANTPSNRRPLANTFQTRLKLDPPCGASLAERLHDF